MDASAPTSSYQSSNHLRHTADNKVYQYFLQAFLDRLCEMVARTRPRTVLDAGCGEGFVTDYLKSYAPELELTGVDLSDEAIAHACAHFGEGIRFETGTLYDLPFADDAFDTVLCSEVLEHLEAPGRALDELRRVARRHVVVTVPREPYFKWLNDLGRRLGLSPDPGHVNFWTQASFQQFIRTHLSDTAFAWKHVYQLAVGRA